MALSSNSRLRAAAKKTTETPPSPTASAPVVPSGQPASSAVPPADEIANLLAALDSAEGSIGAIPSIEPAVGDVKADEVPSPSLPVLEPVPLPKVPEEQDHSAVQARKIGQPSPLPPPDTSPIDFILPPDNLAAPVGGEKPPAEPVDFILPVVGEASTPVVAEKPATVRLSRTSENSNQAKSATGAIRLSHTSTARITGQQPDVSKTAKHGTVRLTGSQPDVIKTSGHGTVRLTGPQVDPSKSALHHTVRLTGQQPAVGETAKHGTVRLTGQQPTAKIEPEKKLFEPYSPPPAPVNPLAEEPKDAVETGSGSKKKFLLSFNSLFGKKKTPKGNTAEETSVNSRKEIPVASIVVLVLILLVVVAYILFFIVKPQLGSKPQVPNTQNLTVPVQSVKSKPVVTKNVVEKKTSESTVVKEQTVEKNMAVSTDKPQTVSGTKQDGKIVDIPEDDSPKSVEPVTAEEKSAPSKFLPPWMRKQTPEETTVKETVLEVQEAVDVPEEKVWPALMVTAVIGSGKKGSALVNGNVVSIGEELEEGPTLKSISKQSAVFEWDGETRTIHVSSKVEE